MAAGSSGGAVGVFYVTPPSCSGEDCSFSGCRLLLRGGHSDVRPDPMSRSLCPCLSCGTYCTSICCIALASTLSSGDAQAFCVQFHAMKLSDLAVLGSLTSGLGYLCQVKCLFTQ